MFCNGYYGGWGCSPSMYGGCGWGGGCLGGLLPVALIAGAAFIGLSGRRCC